MSIVPLFTRRCACCNEAGPDLCATCRFALASSPAVRPAAGVAAALTFDGAARQAILALKFANRRGVARHLAGLAVDRLGLERRPRFDVVTWAPTSVGRARRRGYDQAELLARHVARELGVPCRRLLYRCHGDPQAGRGRAERLAGPAFRSRRPGRPLRVLVVDDVVTTGATLRMAAEVLRAAGVAEVVTVAIAATPAAASRPALVVDPTTGLARAG